MKRFTKFVTFAGVALLLGACADDTNQFPGFISDPSALGFRVITSDPFFNEEFVPVGQDIRVLFNEPVDSNAVAGGLTVTETIGNLPTDITAEGSLTLIDGGTMLLYTPNKPYALESRVQMNLSAGLRSVSGRNLIPATVTFYTGAAFGTGFGRISLPGPVKCNDITYYPTSIGGCAIVQVDFPEDLAAAPRANVQACEFDCDTFFGGLFSNGPIQAYLEPAFGNLDRSFIVYPTYCLETGLLTNLTLDLRDIIDLQNEGPVSCKKEFDIRDFGLGGF